MKDQNLLIDFLKDAVADYVCESGELNTTLDVTITIDGGWADVKPKNQ
jgi:hypothetical protein